MKAPEKGNAMVQAMPKVHPGVEEENCSEEMRPARQRPPIQQSEVVGTCPLRSGPPERYENQPDHGRVQKSQDEIFQAVTKSIG